MDRPIGFSSRKRENLKNFTKINFSGGNLIMCESIFWKEKKCEKINFPQKDTFWKKMFHFSEVFHFRAKNLFVKLLKLQLLHHDGNFQGFQKVTIIFNEFASLLKKIQLKKVAIDI